MFLQFFIWKRKKTDNIENCGINYKKCTLTFMLNFVLSNAIDNQTTVCRNFAHHNNKN